MISEAIRVEGLSKSFPLEKERISILQNINLSIEQGEFVSIMGPSGSGKSTLLYLIGGLDTVDRGAVFINGKDISSFEDSMGSAMRRKDVGLIFQSYNLIGLFG